jgi:hypothetical protein
MKKLLWTLLIVSLLAALCYVIPVLAASTADVDITVTLATGPPTVETLSITDIADTSFTANGNVTSSGGGAVTRRGFCYILGTAGDPTTADSVVYTDGTFGAGTFSESITGLEMFTYYRVRAYAVNGEGTSYGVTLQTITRVPDNTIIITGTGVMTITGPNPFSSNVTSISVSVNAAVDNMTIEVNK